MILNTHDNRFVEAISLSGDAETRIYPVSDCFPLYSVGEMMDILYKTHNRLIIEMGVEGYFSTCRTTTDQTSSEHLCDALWDSFISSFQP